MINAPWPLLMDDRGGVKVPLEPGTSPTFTHLFLGILATFPKGVIKIHPQLSELFC